MSLARAVISLPQFMTELRQFGSLTGTGTSESVQSVTSNPEVGAPERDFVANEAPWIFAASFFVANRWIRRALYGSFVMTLSMS